MIKVSLHVPPPHADNTPVEARAIVARARAMALQLYRNSRSQLARHLRVRRRQSFEQGYQQGLLQARSDLALISDGLRRNYGAMLDMARADAHRLALEACEEFLHERISLDASPLLPWLEQAVEVMKLSRTISISYHPRLGPSFENLRAVLGENVTLTSGSPDQTQDFVVRGDCGEVEFSWREALRSRLGHVSHRPVRRT
jgi:hypothetical protein